MNENFWFVFIATILCVLATVCHSINVHILLDCLAKEFTQYSIAFVKHNSNRLKVHAEKVYEGCVCPMGEGIFFDYRKYVSRNFFDRFQLETYKFLFNLCAFCRRKEYTQCVFIRAVKMELTEHCVI